MATTKPRWRKWKARRLRKRIAVLEDDRIRLTAYLLHFRKGVGDPKYLNRRLRRSLRRHRAYGELLEAIEKRSRRLRDELAELEAGQS